MKNLVKTSLFVGCILVTGKVIGKVITKKNDKIEEEIDKKVDEFNEKMEKDLDNIKEIKNLDDKIDALIDMVRYYQKRNEENVRYLNISSVLLKRSIDIAFYGLMFLICYDKLCGLKIEISNIIKEAK